jgi:hypothetical protein
LTLFVLPVLYSIFHRDSDTAKAYEKIAQGEA